MQFRSTKSATESVMTTMAVSLPDFLKVFVHEQVCERGYGSASEYVRELIRKDRDRQHLRATLLAGAASAAGVPADATCFARLRDRVQRCGKG